MEKNSKKCQNLTKNSQNFDQKIEIRKRCKGVHCVDLGESFPTSIYLQKSASIQPRTSPSKFGGKFNSLFTSLLSGEHCAAPTPGARALGASAPLSDRLRGELCCEPANACSQLCCVHFFLNLAFFSALLSWSDRLATRFNDGFSRRH